MLRRAGREAMFLLYHFFILCTPLTLHLMVSLSNGAATYRSRAHFNVETRKRNIERPETPSHRARASVAPVFFLKTQTQNSMSIIHRASVEFAVSEEVETLLP